MLVLVACLGSWFWCKSKAEDVMEGAGEVVGELNRISLGLRLSTMKMSCASDPSGAGTASAFHPQAFTAYQGIACQVNDQTIAAIRQSCTPPEGQPVPSPCSTVQSATASGDAGRALGVGLTADSCFTYTSGSMKIVGCSVQDQGFQIIHLENPGAVQ